MFYSPEKMIEKPQNGPYSLFVSSLRCVSNASLHYCIIQLKIQIP